MTIWKVSIVPALLLTAGCAGNPVAPDAPTWVNGLVRQLEPTANPPAFVAQYAYKGQNVYFVPQRCCDVMSVVYANDGAIICHPDGGIAGKGDGMCADFLTERRNERIIWRDSKR
jgi:hypothetical protein